MDLKKQLVGLAIAASFISVAPAVLAGPPGGNVPPHRHFVELPSGDLIEVGPDACANGPSRQFDNFHNNVHLGNPNIVAGGCG